MSAPIEPIDPPETLEGWYALHQIFRLDREALRAMSGAELAEAKRVAGDALVELAAPPGRGAGSVVGAPAAGWSAVAPLIGSLADVMFVHFRPTIDELGEADRRLRNLRLMEAFTLSYTFLSITEVGLYQLAAHGPDDPQRSERLRAERESAHVQRRLYPALPADMPYVSFYPMSKRRAVEQNWYRLPLTDRSRLMHSHGLTGRRYSGRVLQIITGAIGLDAWEWGVTLFAKDPVDFKKLVTEMRFDEASANYADFGAFYVGRIAEPRAWLETIGR